MRLGNMQGKLKVRYHTEDASAKAGSRYEASSKQVVFKDGEHTKQIKVGIVENDQWSTTLEFKMVLTDPENCELGLYLHICRVKIIDNDLFPSSKYRKLLESEEGVESVSAQMLFLEYWRLIFHTDGILWRTIMILLLDQMRNLYLFFTLYMNVYLVDTLFATGDPDSNSRLFVPGNRKTTAIVVGALYIGPMFILHLWDYYKVKLDTGGKIRDFLQTNLFRKYLNYGEYSRCRVLPSLMQVAIVQDTAELQEGYMATLNMCEIVGRLVIMVYFILLENPGALVPAITMPTLMLIFVWLRSSYLIEACEHAVASTAKLIEIVTETCQKYRLVADYFQRPQMCDRFHHTAEALSEAMLPVDLIRMNNNYFPKWLGPIFVGLYIAVEAPRVLQDPPAISMGIFLATIKIFNELSEQFSEAYRELMSISSAIGPLRKLTYYFNLPTDVKLWKTINRKRREFTKVARSEVLGASSRPRPVDSKAANSLQVVTEPLSPTNGVESFKSDRIELKVIGMSFKYPGTKQLLKSISVSVPQGKFVALVGPHGCGKSTFLRLLGHSIFPDEGMIFVPTHLRLLHVAQEPMLLQLTAWQNLVFGRHNADPHRVCAILERLEMEKTLEMIEDDVKKHMAPGVAMPRVFSTINGIAARPSPRPAEAASVAPADEESGSEDAFADEDASSSITGVAIELSLCHVSFASLTEHTDVRNEFESIIKEEIARLANALPGKSAAKAAAVGPSSSPREQVTVDNIMLTVADSDVEDSFCVKVVAVLTPPSGVSMVATAAALSNGVEALRKAVNQRLKSTKGMSAITGSSGRKKEVFAEIEDVRVIEQSAPHMGRWQEKLAYAEKAKLHLARAMIVNPEVLVLQRPLVHYDDAASLAVMGVIREYVSNRGLCLPAHLVSRRRPRTCFFSPSTKGQAAQADVIWKLRADGQVQEVPLEELTKDDIPT